MSDLNTLTEAFTELERRADRAGTAPVAQHILELEPTAARAHGPVVDIIEPARRPARIPLLAAAGIATVAVAAGTALLVQNGQGSPSSPVQAGGGPSGAAHATSAAARSAPPAAPDDTFRIPLTPRELAHRFARVLDGTATFTVTDTGAAVNVAPPDDATGKTVSSAAKRARIDAAESKRKLPDATGSAIPISPNGAAIVGALTASGVTGGYDIQVFRAAAGVQATCSVTEAKTCVRKTLPDGSSLALNTIRLDNAGAPGGITYEAELVRPDRAAILMHVSNASDPKGESTVHSAEPPLSRKQVAAIVTSDRW